MQFDTGGWCQTVDALISTAEHLDQSRVLCINASQPFSSQVIRIIPVKSLDFGILWEDDNETVQYGPVTRTVPADGSNCKRERPAH